VLEGKAGPAGGGGTGAGASAAPAHSAQASVWVRLPESTPPVCDAAVHDAALPDATGVPSALLG